jgi:acyl-CoA thioesterase FadM
MDPTSFPLLDDVVAPDTASTPGAHVVDFEIQKLLSQGWQRYAATVREASGDQTAAVVRQITTVFESECHGGDGLLRGVRAVGRTNRSYVLEEALWDAETKRLVATSRVVMACLDPTTGKAATIPDALWAAVESLEGRTVERIERNSSSTPST